MSSRALDRLKKAVLARPQALDVEKAKGRKVVGWINYNLPLELLHALDLIPVRIGKGGDDQLVDTGARWISTKNCVFTRETVGLFDQNTDPYVTRIDLFAVDATCLQVFRAAEVIEHYFKRQTLVLGVPRNFTTPEAGKYFRAEVADFLKKLEEFAGRKLEPAKLQKSVGLYNEIRELVRRLYLRQTSSAPGITWRQTFEAVHAGHTLAPEDFRDHLFDLLEELESQVFATESQDVRVFLSGSLIPPSDHKLINLIESLGGTIVGDDLWTGLAPYWLGDIEEASVEGVADAYLRRVPHAALPYFDLATDGRYRVLKELLKTFRADAVIYHTLRYCDAYTFKANELKVILQKEQIPFLEIHTEYATSDIEAIRTRVEAFLELVRHQLLLEV
jgi:benzoyl-CoA reductase/2-hydroxyglutaryl-CoA dehydratase subunit BcrC/BadD/HgdB